MTHPYRIVVTSAGARYITISLVKVSNLDAMPTRTRHPCVIETLYQARVSAPRGIATGVCNPPRPGAIPETVYERELSKAYALLDKLASAPSILEMQEQ